MAKRKSSAASKKLPENRQLGRKLKKNRGNPKPTPPPKEYQFKPGQSGNPGGRPKLLSNAYKNWLATINEAGISNAEAVALAMGTSALRQNVNAAREMRSATEGEMLKLSRLSDQELLDLLLDNTNTDA